MKDVKNKQNDLIEVNKTENTNTIDKNKSKNF